MQSGTLGMSTAIPTCQVGGLAFSDVMGTNNWDEQLFCQQRNLTISPLLNKLAE